LNNSRAVIDSNIMVFSAIDTDQSPLAEALWRKLKKDSTAVYAPRLWVSEVTSGIHKYLFAKVITPEYADTAILSALKINIKFLDETPELCLSASHWATRLNQMAAYDGFYLAAAESLDAPLWTGDKRLVNTAMQLGLSWVHWMGDLE